MILEEFKADIFFTRYDGYARWIWYFGSIGNIDIPYTGVAVGPWAVPPILSTENHIKWKITKA